jgi:hypothetical protein
MLEAPTLSLLSAFTISATFSVSAVLHPTRDVDFSRHRPTVWVPGIDVLADERLVSGPSLLAAMIDSLQFTSRLSSAPQVKTKPNLKPQTLHA